MDEERKDPFDGEYIGNIWGWKFSLMSLALILTLLLALWCRSTQLTEEDWQRYEEKIRLEEQQSEQKLKENKLK
ncbi:MAG: hypothetical protein AAFP19_12910 [Bacteroidota bacterium]